MSCFRAGMCQTVDCLAEKQIRKLLMDEEAVCQSAEYRSVRQLEVIGQMFEHADADHSGAIDADEFIALFDDLKRHDLLGGVAASPAELFKKMDFDGSGEVDFQEFNDWLITAIGHGDNHDHQIATSGEKSSTPNSKVAIKNEWFAMRGMMGGDVQEQELLRISERANGVTKIPARQGWLARDDQALFGGWTLYWAELNGHDPYINLCSARHFSFPDGDGKWPITRPSDSGNLEALEPLSLHYEHVDVRGGGEENSLELIYNKPVGQVVRLHFRSPSSQQDWWVAVMQTRDMTRRVRLSGATELKAKAKPKGLASIIFAAFGGSDGDDDAEGQTAAEFEERKVEKPRLLRTVSGMDIIKDEETGNTHVQPHYWTIAKMAFEKVLQQIIRPPRADYTMDDLGPRYFEFNGTTYLRKDFRVTNKRNIFLNCSQWVKLNTSGMLSNGPCLIYLHGNASCRCESLKVLSLCLLLDISLVTLDMSGSGMSGAKYVSLGHYEKDDVAAVSNYLRDNGFATSVGIWGRSMGATAALMYASQVDPDVAAIVADSAFSSLHRLAQDLVGMATQSMGEPQGFVTDQAIGMVSSAVKHRAGFNISDVDPLRSIHSCQRPVLFVWADSDKIVLPEHAQRLKDAHNGYSELCSVPGNHMGTRPFSCYLQAAEFLHLHLVNQARDNELAALRCIAKYVLRRKNKRKAEVAAGWLANLDVGDRVEVRFRGSEDSIYHSGTISRARINGTYDIEYEDGTIAIGVDGRFVNTEPSTGQEGEATDSESVEVGAKKRGVSLASLLAADSFLSGMHKKPGPSDPSSSFAQLFSKLSAINGIQASVDVVANRYSWKSEVQQTTFEKNKRELFLNPLSAPPWFIEAYMNGIYPEMKKGRASNPLQSAKKLIALLNDQGRVCQQQFN